MAESSNGQEPSPLASLRVSDIAHQFPGALSTTEKEQVTRRVERILRSIDELRQYPLTNAHEPATIFKPVGREQR